MAHRNTPCPLLLPLVAMAALSLGTTSLAVAQTTSPTTPDMADGSLQQSHNAWRSIKLDGATVYNAQGASVGTIDDMLLNSSGKVSNVVLSVGGFLGMDSKYVEAPFSKLKFESSKGNPAGSGANATTSADGHDYSIVLPGVSKASLMVMTAFS